MKGTGRPWQNLLIWIKLRYVSVRCQSFIAQAVFCWSGKAKRHFGPTWLNISFIPITSQTLVLPSSRPSGSCQKGAWLLLCQHCTHNGRLQENIWQLLIYRTIRAQYLLWRTAKVPDLCWATCSVCDIWSTPRPKPFCRRTPLHEEWPLSSAASKSCQLHDHASTLQRPAYLLHIMTEEFTARDLLLNSSSTRLQDPPEITLIQFWHPSQSYFMYCFSKLLQILVKPSFSWWSGYYQWVTGCGWNNIKLSKLREGELR